MAVGRVEEIDLAKTSGTERGERKDWTAILAEGAAIVQSYSTEVTLRQLHYRLVAAGIGGYTNTLPCYKYLSTTTAERRRDGTFPSLLDGGRSVSRPYYDDSIVQALDDMASRFRLNRTRGQHFQIWLLFEKATLSAQFDSWTRLYGIPMAALRGYSSETLEREVFDEMAADGRPAVVFYVGDLDPEGEDIERNFRAQAERLHVRFAHWERLAVLPDQIVTYGLVRNPAKEKSTRAPGFVRKYGQLFQIETEAVDPVELQRLVTEAITRAEFFDEYVYGHLVLREAAARAGLNEFANTWHDEEAEDEADPEA